jgi:hypothetical protein
VTASDGDKDRPENIVYFLTGQGIDPDRKNDCRLLLIARNSAVDPDLLNPVPDLGFFIFRIRIQTWFVKNSYPVFF